MPFIDINKPELISYVRIEPLTTAKTLKETVKGQVHDALWMLTQQYRVGEFKGEDAGSPMKARVQTQSTKINRFKSRSGEVEEYDQQVPLEAKVERLPLKEDLGMRLELGNIWVNLAVKTFPNEIREIVNIFLENFFIDPLENDPSQNSNKVAVSIRNLVTRRSIDGVKLYYYFKDGGLPSNLGFPELDEQVKPFM